jgi:hypothetical protein
MPVAIVGMHRSGTSLLAQMLHRCGVYLGSTDRLLAPRPDNPQGFWEHAGFQQLNEAVLVGLGGGWDAPPPVPARWDQDLRLASHATDARHLLDEFAGLEPWGWKDPRTSLTLSLWRELIPDLKVVLCLRNPLEVAVSLRRRDRLAYSAAVGLWQRYNDAVACTPAAGRIVVAYERILDCAEPELARILRFLGINSSRGTLHDAASVRRDDLRHVHLGVRELQQVHCHRSVVELYRRLLSEAGMRTHGLDPAAHPLDPDQLIDERALDELVAPHSGDVVSDDTDQIARIKNLVRDATAVGSAVAVITRGDERLVDLDGRTVLHFPQDERGDPLWHHPASGRTAVTLLEAARADGAEYLLIPAPSVWCLEHYDELRRHLNARYRPVVLDAETAILFDLRRPAAPTAP